MKKLLGILVLGLLLSGNAYAYDKTHIIGDSLNTDCDIITSKDPTNFRNISFIKEKEIKGWDRRKEKSSGWKISSFKAFIFKATFDEGRTINIRVNSEFETKVKAEKQALKYGKMVGQLPSFLRTKNLKTITIHKGTRLFGGGNKDVLIHTGQAATYEDCVEEVILHESGHATLDWAWGGSVKSSKWKKAAKADNKFISRYAKKNPNREDIAETVKWWIGIRCKKDKISESLYRKILEGLPNRLKYLDEQNYDMRPLVCD